MNRSIAAIVAALLLTCTVAGAQQSGTGAEAKAMLERAIAALKSNEATALRRSIFDTPARVAAGRARCAKAGKALQTTRFHLERFALSAS